MGITRQYGRYDMLVVLFCILALCGFAAIGGRGRERARVAVCQANLRQLGDAMSLFLNDHEDRYPSACAWLVKDLIPTMGYQRFCRWHDARYPPDGPVWAYVAKGKTALCPTFAGFAKRLGRYHACHMDAIPIDPQFSYVMNAFLGPGGTLPPGVGTSAEITRRRAEVFVFAEENLWMRPGNSMVMDDTALRGDGREWFGTFHGVSRRLRNCGTINAAFADGHAQKVHSALVTTEDLQMNLSDAEYGLFEKCAWPFDRPPR